MRLAAGGIGITVVILAITGFLLFLTFVVGVWRMMLAVMLVRPSSDQIFDWMKMSFDQHSGPGAAINALVIAMAIIAVAHVPGVVLVAPLLARVGFLFVAAASLLQAPDPTGGLRLFLTLTTYAAVSLFHMRSFKTARPPCRVSPWRYVHP